MLMLSKKFVTNNMSPHNDPIAIAKSGDTVCFETRDCYDDRLHGDGSNKGVHQQNLAVLRQIGRAHV